MFDIDPQQPAATRHKFYDMAAAEKALVVGFHFSFPSLGHVEKKLVIVSYQLPGAQRFEREVTLPRKGRSHRVTAFSLGVVRFNSSAFKALLKRSRFQCCRRCSLASPR